jgi:hypothetical protein
VAKIPLLLLLLLLAIGRPMAAQTCFHFGSQPVAGSWLPAPFALDCQSSLPWPQTVPWPQWHLLTPPHRAPAPHTGFAPGEAQALPRLLFEYRCTGWLLAPVVVHRVRRMGYVIDQPELPCAGG